MSGQTDSHASRIADQHEHQRNLPIDPETMRPVACFRAHLAHDGGDIIAVRYRKGRASPWQTYWNNPLTGKRECANFGTQREAERHDSLIKHRIRFDRESFRKEEEEHEEKTSTLTLEGAYLMYLRHKQFSRKGLQWQMDAMRYPLSQIGMLPITEITRRHLEQIREAMLAMPVKQTSTRGRLSVLRTVLRWCAAQGIMNPLEFPKLPPAQYEKFIPPTPGELAEIMAAAAPHVVRVIILGAQGGVRVGPSEMFRLTWDDVDLIQGILRVHGAKKILTPRGVKSPSVKASCRFFINGGRKTRPQEWHISSTIMASLCKKSKRHGFPLCAGRVSHVEFVRMTCVMLSPLS
nr:hypothetical protein [uncultured Desulfovibrio sp.]